MDVLKTLGDREKLYEWLEVAPIRLHGNVIII